MSPGHRRHLQVLVTLLAREARVTGQDLCSQFLEGERGGVIPLVSVFWHMLGAQGYRRAELSS